MKRKPKKKTPALEIEVAREMFDRVKRAHSQYFSAKTFGDLTEGETLCFLSLASWHLGKMGYE